MSNYRRMNYSDMTPPPPIPKPKGVPVFITEDCQGLDGAVYVHWKYPWEDVDSITGFWLRVAKSSDPTTTIREVYVADPDTDTIITGLTNLTLYVVTASAVNPGGEGAPNGGVGVMPAAPTIPAPTLKTLTGGDGEAIATWTWGAPLKAGLVWAWMSYQAVNEASATVDEHVTAGEWPAESGSLPLTNDHDWTCALVAVAQDTTTKKYYVSAPSRQLTVHTEKPIAPYTPRLTGAQIDSGNAGRIVCSFAPGTGAQMKLDVKKRRWRKPKARLVAADYGPMDITAWQVRVTSLADSKVTYTYDIADGKATTYTTEKVALGDWAVDCRAQNSVGWSAWSNRLTVSYKPTDSRPFTSDKPYGNFDDANYWYAIFDPGNDVTQGWDTTWKLTLTAAGAGVNFGFIAIGAGGGGKGQTVTLGKGGNGGGGYPMYGAIPGQSAGATITVFISKGGSTAIDPKDTRITAATVYLAPSGKSATSAADAAGQGRDRVQPEWWETSPFRWNQPMSTYVGGVAELGNQAYPDAIRWGEAGAGTKTSHGGNGYEGLVILRWPK